LVHYSLYAWTASSEALVVKDTMYPNPSYPEGCWSEKAAAAVSDKVDVIS